MSVVQRTSTRLTAADSIAFSIGAVLSLLCALVMAYWSLQLALLAVAPAGLLVAASLRRLSLRWRRGLLTSGFVIGVLLAGVVFAALNPHAPTRVIELDPGGTGAFLAAENLAERKFADIITPEGSLVLVDPRRGTRTRIGHGVVGDAHIQPGARSVFFWRDSDLLRWERQHDKTTRVWPEGAEARVSRDGKWLAYWDPKRTGVVLVGVEGEQQEFINTGEHVGGLVVCHRGEHVSLSRSTRRPCSHPELQEHRLDVWRRGTAGWSHSSLTLPPGSSFQFSDSCRFLVSWRANTSSARPAGLALHDLDEDRVVEVPEAVERTHRFDAAEGRFCFVERRGAGPEETAALVCLRVGEASSGVVLAERVRWRDLYWSSEHDLVALAANCASRDRASCDLQVLRIGSGQTTTLAQSVALEIGELSPDGTWLTAVDTMQRRMTLFNLEAGTAQRLPITVGEHPRVHFSPDKRHVAVLGDGDVESLLLWDLAAGTGQVIAEDVQREFSFSPDGKRLVYMTGGPSPFRVPFGAADRYGTLTVFDGVRSEVISTTANSDTFLLTDEYLAYSTVPTHYPFGSSEILWHMWMAPVSEGK